MKLRSERNEMKREEATNGEKPAFREVEFNQFHFREMGGNDLI